MHTTRINYNWQQDNEGPRPEPAIVRDDSIVAVAEPLNPLPTIPAGTPTTAWVNRCEFYYVDQDRPALPSFYTLTRPNGSKHIVHAGDVRMPKPAYLRFVKGEKVVVSLRVGTFNRIVEAFPAYQRGPVEATPAPVAKPAPVEPQSTDINDYFSA